jgi:hypothetical protein
MSTFDRGLKGDRVHANGSSMSPELRLDCGRTVDAWLSWLLIEQFGVVQKIML